MTEPSLERLLAMHDIAALKARYFRCLDTQDWEGYAATFAPDGVLEVASIRAEADCNTMSRRETGRATIVAWISGVLAGAETIHHGHMPEIVVETADTARGIWAMEDRVIWPERALHGWGHYHEQYRQIDGRWHIAHSRLTRLKVEVVARGGPLDPGRPAMLGIAS